MSSAPKVPETWELTGDDARRTLLHTGRSRLLRDAFVRLRRADGFSHARSLSFMVALGLLQGIIGLVGLAVVVGNRTFGRIVADIVEQVAPGPAGEALTQTVRQAESVASSGQYLGLIFGLVGALVTATTMLGQTERALNRLYGIEQDRPTAVKYGRAFVLAITAGAAAVAALVLLAFGHAVRDATGSRTVREVWDIARWPIAFLLVIATIALIFRKAPARHQPAWSWLAYGATISAIAWALVTVALGLVFEATSSFGATYGPLAGTVALLLWALCSSVAVLFGAAVAAQLEAVRAGRPFVEHSHPTVRPGVHVAHT